MASPQVNPNLSLQQVADADSKTSKLLQNHPSPLVAGNHSAVNEDHTDQPKKYKRRRYCWCCCGVFLCLLAIQLTFVPHLVTKSIRNGIVDAFVFSEPQPDNDHYQQWITNSGSNSVPIMFSIQFFNVTNPDEVLLGAMPKLNLVGPLVYNQYYWRRNVTFYPSKEYVNQTFFTEYFYNAELSKIRPDERLTLLSPLVGTLYHHYNVSRRVKRDAMEELMKMFEADPNLLFWRDKTAADLIWSIYHFNHFGFNFDWGFMRNQSRQYYVLHTGYNDPTRMGEVQRWCRDPLEMSCLLNESTQYIESWDPPMQIAPAHLFYEGVYALTDLQDRNNVPPLWIDILFRNIYLQYNKTYNFKGVELYKYGIQLDPQLANTKEFPPNAQFNQFGPSGILNSSAAYDDISIFLAMVLFYGAPDYLANNTKLGIPRPGPFDYPYIDIEPKTGAVFYANASMQICTPMHSLPNVNNVTIEKNKPSLFNLTDDMMVPLYLVTFSDEVTDSIATQFKKNMAMGSTVHEMSVVIGWTAVAFLLIWGFVTMFALGGWYYGRKMKNAQ